MIKFLLVLFSAVSFSADAGVSITGGSFSLNSNYSFIRVKTSDGHGSTNNKIQKLTTEVSAETVGSGITYANTAAAGASFTVNNDGFAWVQFSNNSGTVDEIGISKSSDELTTAIGAITLEDRMCLQSIGTNTAHSVACGFPVSSGDVIRPHTDGTPGGTTLAHMSVMLIHR